MSHPVRLAEPGSLDDVLQERADRMMAAAGPALSKADRSRGAARKRRAG